MSKNLYGISYVNVNPNIICCNSTRNMLLSINYISYDSSYIDKFHNIIYNTLEFYMMLNIERVLVYASHDITELNDYVERRIGGETHYKIPIDFILQHADKHVLRCVLEDKRALIDEDIRKYCYENVKSARNV